MELNEYDKSRCRYHLGYNSGANVPAGDFAAMEEAMARIPDSIWYSKITEHLDRCDRAFKITEILKDSSQPLPSRIETIIGDTNRSIFQSDPLQALKTYREIYLAETDYLAESMYVPNYRREEVRVHAFHRPGVEFIDAVPGPADTAVGTRLFFSDHWC